MKFISAEDNEEINLYQRMVSDCGKVEIGIYPVMFGYRVRAGFVNDVAFFVDWCAGDDQTQIELLYAILKNILESGYDLRKLPPVSKIKPFYNDAEFLKLIESLVVNPLSVESLKPVHLDRIKLMNSL